MQEGDHSDHTEEATLYNSGSSIETLSPTDAQPMPALLLEMKATVHQIGIQLFGGIAGEPYSPQNQNGAPIQTGPLHEISDQV